MSLLVDCAYGLAGTAYLPALAYQMMVQGKNRTGWRQRFGWDIIAPGGRPRIWVHGVSLGEINATAQIVPLLERKIPGHDVVVSSTTDTGFARACGVYGAERVFRFPLDFGWVVRRLLQKVQVELLVLMELEVWYNLVRTAAWRGIPVCVVNGRLTDRSARRFRLLGRFARQMFADLAWVGAQDEEIAERFRAVGVPSELVTVTGSLKWDTATTGDRVSGADELALAVGLTARQAVWVCGSTGPGEEQLILDAYERLRAIGRAVTLVIVPRKPERFDEVAKLIVGRGHRCVRRSERPDARAAAAPLNGSDVVLGDTMGELRKFYGLADVVYVGRSLVPMGGSDPMEAAALAKPIICGPHMENFAVAEKALRSCGALNAIPDERQLADAVGAHLADSQQSKRLGAAGRETVLANQGATRRTVDNLRRVMGEFRKVEMAH